MLRYNVSFYLGYKKSAYREVYTNKKTDAISLAKILSKHVYVDVIDHNITDDVPIIYSNY